MSLPAYEKLGVFYLGREYDPQADALGEDLLYDSRDLTTHAVCIGMTGSGKTGLCISLLEEAALDGVPSIVIDPKGDLGNLALAFPELRPADFAPWVDPGEAARRGKTVAEYAESTAETWRRGLADWNEDGARIARLQTAAEVAIYTPGSTSGRPLSILRSFDAPDAALLADATALRERIAGAVGGLLGLLGIETDPIRSREHILLSAILDDAWRKGRSPDLAALIQTVQKPPFDRVGVFDLESFFPARDRNDLALRINAVLAAPGFDAWLQGEPLDVQRLLYTAEGRPRIAIVSVAHLGDAERMLVVTLVANELVAWMRRQSGTTSLRALFYIDEVFGYLPPSAMPPSKLPLLTLMKQARAFGLGVVLATQNPVDLDYKSLGNAGTWLIGRLQTERDRERVAEGLLGTGAAAGLDRATVASLLANLSQRTFLMRNVHEDAPVLFRSRWALSYLRGPMTLQEIARLRQGAAAGDTSAASSGVARSAQREVPAVPFAANRPVIQAGIRECFVHRPGTAATPTYRGHFGARVRAHFVDARAGMDAWETWYCLAPLGEDGPDWPSAETASESELAFADEPASGAAFADLPAAALAPRSYASWTRQLADHVYRTATLEVFRCPVLGVTAAPGGTEGDFRAHIAHGLRERRDATVEALRDKYADRLARLENRLRRSEQKLERERSQATSATASTVLSVGGSLLGALFGGRRRASVLGRASTAVSRVGRVGRERADVEHAEADTAAVRGEIDALRDELQAEVDRLQGEFDPNTARIDTVTIRPRKADIAVEDPALVWVG